MAHVANITALQGHFLSFILWLPLQDPEISNYCTASFNAMKKHLLKILWKKVQTQKKMFSIAIEKIMWHYWKVFHYCYVVQYPCFHHVSLVQHTASRVKTTAARGILQAKENGSRDLFPAGFSTFQPEGKELIKTTHPVNISLHFTSNCEFNWSSHCICVD